MPRSTRRRNQNGVILSEAKNLLSAPCEGPPDLETVRDIRSDDFNSCQCSRMRDFIKVSPPFFLQIDGGDSSLRFQR
jgi:hypothetical protein